MCCSVCKMKIKDDIIYIKGKVFCFYCAGVECKGPDFIRI